MKRLSRSALALVWVWVFAACSSYMGVEASDFANQANQEGTYASGIVVDTRGRARSAASESDRSPKGPGSTDAGSTSISKDRKVVYKAEYSLRTSNLTVALARAKALVQEMGGWVQEEGSGKFSFRVPADKFWATTEKITDIGQILDHSIKSKDVTEEYMDLGIRLQVRKKFLGQLEELYAKGGSLQDLLAVKKEIDRVTEEIERLEGKIRFLQEQVAWSTIRLRFLVQSEYVSRDFNLPFRWLQSLGIQTLLNAR